MATVQPVRGTHDLMAATKRRHQKVEETAAHVAALYGFEEIDTPIFEFTEVFARTLGETSDIVTKEMYTFEDRSGDSITLRPEGTAGIARAFISNGLTQNLPLKLFYRGPMFRYERPQKGRLRQFHQVGVELLGVDTPQADVEVIALAAQILRDLGFSDAVILELNTLGDTESREAYRRELVDYLSRHKDKLSEDSIERLDRNPLRILDSKDESDKAVIEDAPSILDSLNEASRTFFDEVRRGLEALNVSYVINPRMVRGLDYYCHTAFEFTTQTLGAQGTVIAGGRYDGLIQQMGGPPTPGIGWAAGVERLAMMFPEDPAAPRPVVVIPVGEESQETAERITSELRHAGIVTDMGYSGNLGKRMKRANKAGARAAVILGDEELKKNAATVRDMDSGEQTEVPFDGLIAHLETMTTQK